MTRLFMMAMLVIVLILMTAEAALAEEHALKRHALLVSANDGGSGRTPLRYAKRDTQILSRVLSELGGVDPQDALLVSDATATTLEAGVAEIHRRILRDGATTKRQEMIFYYSGHSDEEGLLLGDSRLSYSKLRDMISKLPVDVRLMILDSCASGQLTLAKGGQRRPPFLLDSSVKAKGQAVITSASADEAAQESARIEGSFFTHYLVSGLRGAADSNADRRVTLSEAYQYAYSSTLARTETTRGGPQHPSYDFQLAGTGDLILTDLRVSAAALVFAKPLAGRYFVRDDQGTLVAEIVKQPGRPVHLGLEPGSYAIIRGQGSRYGEAKIQLAQKQELDIEGVTFAELEGEPAVARGAGAPVALKEKKASFQLIPDFADDSVTATEEHRFMFGLLGGRSGKLRGGSFSLLGHVVEEGGVDGVMVSLFGVNYDKGDLSGAQIGFVGNYVAGSVSGIQIGMFNWSAAKISGAQVGLGNLASSDVRGAQIGLINYTNGTVAGAQLGYGINVATVAVRGTQASLLNYAPSVAGIQAGLVNVTRSAGFFQAGMIDVADTTPAQVGMVNVARMTKAQVGFVNVAGSTSGQVGLVNYATEAKWSLGLISYVGNGTLDVGTWIDEHAFAHLTVRMGSKYLYTIYDAADRSTTGGNVDSRYDQAYGLGLGTHMPLGDRLAVGVEVLVHGMPSREDDDEEGDDPSLWFVRSHALLSFRVVSGLQVVAGPSYGFYPGVEAEFREVISSDKGGEVRYGRHNTRWVGYSAGLRYQLKG